MTAGLLLLLLVAIWLARPRPLIPYDRRMQMSEKWRIDHLYENGKR